MSRTVMIRRLTVLAATVLLAMVVFASPAWAETFTVDRIDDPIPVEGAGACSVLSNDCSLRGAIEKSTTNGQADTIGFALPGAGPHTITLSDALTTGNEATDDLTINGLGQSLLTVRQSAQVRVFQIVGKTTINGITISGGRSINNAGGILNGGNLTLNDATVTDNQARGASDNQPEPEGLGGGIYNASAATLTLNRSTVSGNTIANAGGGIYNANGALTLNNSTVSGNHARFVGGGIYSDTDLTGPIKTTVTNSTISGNTADFWGGGISNSNGLTVIEHSTITNNTAPCCGWGSGVSSHGEASTRTEVLSTIISDNTNTDVDFVGGPTNSFLSKGFNMIGDGNAIVAPNNAFNNTGDQTGVANPGLNPALASNGGSTQTHALLIGPAIDGGPSSPCPATDQRGVPRPQGPTCDIGAFEKNAPPPAPSTPNLAPASDTGLSSTDNITRDTTPTFTGTAQAGSTVKIFDGTTQVGSGPASSSGSYSITTSALGQTEHSIRAKATNVEGTGPASSVLKVKIDTTSPRVSATAPTDGQTGLRRNTNLSATFSEKMDRATLTKVTFKLFKVNSDGSTTQVANVTVSSTTDGLKAVLNPFGTTSTLLGANSSYRAFLTTGANDVAGNQLDQSPTIAGNQQKVWTFTTGSS